MTPAERATENQKARLAEADRVAADAALKLANANEAQRKQIIASMQASRQRAAQALQTAQALRAEAAAGLAILRTQQAAAAKTASGGGPGEGIQGRVSSSQSRFNKLRRDGQKLEGAIAIADKGIAEAQGALDGLDKALTDALKPVSLPSLSGVGGAIDADGSGKKDRAGRGGRSAAEIE